MLSLPLAAQAAAPAGVTITKPWMRYLLPGIPAGGYMVLHNAGDQPSVLTGATSPACGTLMLHETQDDSGMAMMTMVPAMNIPPHGAVALAPGGYHLMCMQPRMKTGDHIAVTLSFQDGTSLSTSMPVYGAHTGP